MSDFDVIVVGAGSAGIAAAQRLTRSAVNCILLEASARVGGRAWTDTDTFPGIALDRGCHWLHSASINPLRDIADAEGFAYNSAYTFDRTAYYLGGKRASPEDSGSISAAIDSAFTAIETFGSTGPDRSAQDVVGADSPWFATFRAIFGLVTSSTPDRVSTRSMAEYRETHEDYPVEQGLGALLLTQTKGLTIRTSTPVRCIDWSGQGVRVDTDSGTLSARAVIVAVPTSMLAKAQITFMPDLPLSHREAVHALPMGTYEKVALRLSEPLTPEAQNLMILPGDGNDPARPPLSCILSPFGRPLVMADIGGPLAGDLARAGAEALRAHVMEIVVDALGSGFSKQVIGHTTTNWTEQPFIEGAYSAALPGHHLDRTTLQAPVGDRIYLAGEAVSQNEYASCHGAFRSGQAAADRAIAQLKGEAAD